MRTFDEDVDLIKRLIRNERFLSDLGPAMDAQPYDYKADWLDRYGLWLFFGFFIWVHWLLQ